LGEEFGFEGGFEGRFELMGDGHFAGGDFGFGGADEAELAAAEGVVVGVVVCHADGRAEDAAGDGAPGVDVAESGGGVEGGAGGLIGEVVEAGLVGG